MTTFNYKGITIIYDEENDNKDLLVDLLDELFESYYEDLKNVKIMDFRNPDYIVVDSDDVYTYEGGRLEHEGHVKDMPVTEEYRNDERKEFMELCAKLNLPTMKEVIAFQNAHNAKNDKELLAALRAEAAKLSECVDDVRVIGEDLFANVEDDAETIDAETDDAESEENAEEPQTFEEKIDFLVKDEQEAIDGYKKIIDTIDDDFVKEQLNKILIEEEAHKAYLEKVKEDHSVEYTEPLDTEDEQEDDSDEKEAEEGKEE